jgi:hypothetical protein
LFITMSTAPPKVVSIVDCAAAHGIASQRHAQGWQHIVQVLYRLNGKQSSTSFEDLASATKFRHTSSAVKICPRAFWSTALRFQPNLDRRGMRRPRRR